jgi:hypothetical protein
MQPVWARCRVWRKRSFAIQVGGRSQLLLWLDSSGRRDYATQQPQSESLRHDEAARGGLVGWLGRAIAKALINDAYHEYIAHDKPRQLEAQRNRERARREAAARGPASHVALTAAVLRQLRREMGDEAWEQLTKEEHRTLADARQAELVKEAEVVLGGSSAWSSKPKVVQRKEIRALARKLAEARNPESAA